MNRFPRTMLPAAALACLLQSPLAAQDAQRPEVTQGTFLDTQTGVERSYTRLRGQALPTYIVVEQFYYEASSALAGTPEYWGAFLRVLEIDPGSGAESALRAATVAARESVLVGGPDEPPPAWDVVPARTADEQVDRSRGMVARLAGIHASLLADLAADSYPIEKLHEYLENVVRPSTSLSVYPEPGEPEDLDQRILDEERKFDRLVLEALAARGAREAQGEGR